MVPPRTSRVQVTAWVLYDLANTIFALGVIGLYFPSWLGELGLPDSVLAGVQIAAAAVVIFLAPWSGARTDASGKRVPTLIVTTLVAVGGTALLDSGPIPATVGFLWIAVVAVNTGSVVYDALLVNVSTPENRGWVSGLGIGIGYFGSFIGLGIGLLTFETLGWGYSGTFRAMALGFLIFAVPSFFLIHEPEVTRRPPPRMRQVIVKLFASWRLASTYDGVVRFLVGRFFYTDAINTLVGGFLTIFVQAELGFTVADSTALLGLAIAAAVVGGLGAGQLLRKIDPLPLLRVVLVAWIVALGAGIFASVSGITEIAWVIGPLGGMALGATWAADRMVMYRISPPRHLGEFYGLYATVGRFATIVGPLVWAVIVDLIGLSRNFAMGALAGFVAISLFVLRRLDTTQRLWEPDGVTPISGNPGGDRT